MAYVPIEDYGIIGDLHTVALVSKHGSIDWFCFPHLDSPSVFAALLDNARGGRFQIAPSDEGVIHKQLYFPDTNVLITRFLTADGVAESCDFMPVDDAPEEAHRHRLIRRLSVVRGTMRFRIACFPAFDYGRARPAPHWVHAGGLQLHGVAPGAGEGVGARWVAPSRVWHRRPPHAHRGGPRGMGPVRVGNDAYRQRPAALRLLADGWRRQREASFKFLPRGQTAGEVSPPSSSRFPKGRKEHRCESRIG